MGVALPTGRVMRLGEIATVKEYWSPPNIERKRKERVVTVAEHSLQEASQPWLLPTYRRNLTVG
ncbi:MAG: efflux RND transporter permease subunit [Sphingobacterium sp.]|nr:efflux RND transporter permease subunit [Sphingobacterium sp.]